MAAVVQVKGDVFSGAVVSHNSLNSALHCLWLACVLVTGQKKKKTQGRSLELRVYSVKNGLVGHTAYVRSIIVHFSSGGETIPQSLVPKQSASRSQRAHTFPRGAPEPPERSRDSRNAPQLPFSPLYTQPHNPTVNLRTLLFCTSMK